MQAYLLETVDSTNDAAKRLIAEGRLSGSGYVLAREQTAGRGTQGRSWLSPRDAGLYLSFARTQAGPAKTDIRTLTLAAGAACADVLEAATSLNVRIKPVNDLMVEGRKLGGILTEINIEAGEIESLIIGIGINLRRVPLSLPTDARPAICLEELLSAEAFCALDRNALVERLVERVDAYSIRAISGDAIAIEAEWERRLWT